MQFQAVSQWNIWRELEKFLFSSEGKNVIITKKSLKENNSEGGPTRYLYIIQQH